MRYFVLTLFLVLSFWNISNAQQLEVIQDTIIIKAPVLDSTFYKKDIFSILNQAGPYSNKINVEQTNKLQNAFYNHIAQSSNKRITGYRVRIFFDNKQDARDHSLNVMGAFLSGHPGIPTYRTYDTPYFRVTVGDFRTKSEAMQLLKSIESEFPSAFLIKETINFPPL